MGWSGSLNADSALGTAITFTPDTTTAHGYTVGTFTAPKKGIYRFILKGSGGTFNGYHDDGVSSAGGTGGYTVGYLLLEANQTVYIGAGGTCSAAFVSGETGAALKNIAKEKLYFVAGGGGGSGYIYTSSLTTGGNTYTNSTQQGGGAGNNARGSVEVSYYALDSIPVVFNGTQLNKIIYNGTAIEHLIYNGQQLY